jgi:sulfatase-modifying factor enzyme 1
VPELAGECVVGDLAWASDGTLRWFGTVARGLDAIAEAAVVDVAGVSNVAARGLHDPPVELASSGGSPAQAGVPCPPDMVSVGARFCVDRYEGMLVDGGTGEALSPDYPATPHFLEIALADWSTGRERWSDVHARALPLPQLPAWEPGAVFSPVAVSRAGVRPNGYVTGVVAESACTAAGKRLCTLDEFRTACRGEDDTQFPYGSQYVEGACNVDRDDHPAFILHGNASLGHLDPRLDRVSGSGGPLLHLTGATGSCASRWGTDAVYDMVGNLDEWVTHPKRGTGEGGDHKGGADDDSGGAFAGGFYSRGTRAGCNALITTHPRVYLDYSTGVRCCRDSSR